VQRLNQPIYTCSLNQYSLDMIFITQ